MKPEKESLKTLQYTQSVAKTIEFEVPQKVREAIESRFSHQPEDIFDIVISLLGDISEVYRNPELTEDEVHIEEEKLRFCAEFLDNYKNSERIKALDDYCLLIGATAYYLCNLPGSALVLINSINIESLCLDGDGLEYILYSILGERNIDLEKFSESKYYLFLKQISTKIDSFNNSGNDNNILNDAEQLEAFAFKRGSDREIFISDLIFSLLYKKISVSSWKLLPQFSDMPIDNWRTYLSSPKSIKTLWPSQILLGKANVYKGESCVIQLPTSSGKTKSTELIIRSAFLSGRANIAVIIAPFKALCHEIKRDYKKAFKSEKVNIDEINDILTTEDLTAFTKDEDKKSIIILTPEKLYYLLHFDASFIKNIGLLILDEGHQFDSKERGITYELLITYLKQELPETTQKILISAVMSNSPVISSWLNKNNNIVSGNNSLPTKRNIGFFDEEYKGQIKFVDYLTPREQSYFAPRIFDVIQLPLKKREKKERIFPDLKDPKSVALYLAIKMSNKGVTAIYCGTKISVNAILKIVIELYDRLDSYLKPLASSDVEEVLRLSKMIQQNLGTESILFQSSQFGIFSHHLDIPIGIKHCIEYALQKEKIKCVICTSTLSQGVNLPIKYLFIPNTNRDDNYISVRDFQNLIGRVARAGKITDGSIIFTKRDSFCNRHNFDLLDAANSEQCSSSLLDIVTNPNQLYSFSNPQDLVDFYTGKIDLEEIIKRYLDDNYDVANIKDKNALKKEFQLRLKYIASIENFFLLFGDRLYSTTVDNFIETTLAYVLADENQRNMLQYVLGKIAYNIQETIKPEQRIPLAKTMQGVQSSLALSSFYDENKQNFLQCSSSIEVLEQFWPFLITNNIVYQFSYCADKELLLTAVKNWINGSSYYELWNLLKASGKRLANIETVINLFDSGINYNCCVIVNALAELIDTQDEKTLNNLVLLQRQLKYGLPSNKAIVIFELGFCDRCLVQELVPFVKEEKDRDLIRFDLLKSKDEVLEILKRYPSYFESVFYRLNY